MSTELMCTTPPPDALVSSPVNRGTIDLAARPVRAPAILLSRRPLARWIEGARPALVLGEGLRLINAHPLAHTIFWGGLANWLVTAVLAAHHADSTTRFLALLAQLAVWLAWYFHKERDTC